MGYLHINNLYKDQTILMFKECYAMEKIHGTSAHITFNEETVKFSSGGVSYEGFKQLFNEELLLTKFKEVIKNNFKVTIYGEAYGGKCQKMRTTYGDDLKFVVFDVKIGDRWLKVPEAEEFVKPFNLEFVDYNKILTKVEFIDKERDLDSTQAIRNGIGEGKKREGVVLRPLDEFVDKYGQRVIIKHKRDDFRETKTVREILSPDKLKVLDEANAIAEEWVTEMRLTHILDKIKNVSMRDTGEIIKNMQDDIEREGEGEIIWTREAKKSVGQRTVYLLKNYFNKALEVK